MIRIFGKHAQVPGFDPQRWRQRWAIKGRWEGRGKEVEEMAWFTIARKLTIQLSLSSSINWGKFSWL